MFLLISILAALVIFVVSANSSWENVLSPQRNQLVFEGRVKDYGAYKMRKEQPRNMFFALVLSTGIVSSFFLLAQNRHTASPVLAPPVSKEIWTDATVPPIEKAKETPEILPEKPKPASAAAAAGVSADGAQAEIEVTTDVSTTIDTEQTGNPAGNEDGLALGGGGSGEDLTGTGTGEGEGDGSDHSSVVIPDWAEIMPAFPGGEEAMKRFVSDRIRFSERERRMNVQGMLYIGFVVNADGSVSDVQLLNSIKNGQDISKKALKAVESMPRWSPGKNGDKTVRVRIVMPIRLKLD